MKKKYRIVMSVKKFGVWEKVYTEVFAYSEQEAIDEAIFEAKGQGFYCVKNVVVDKIK